jgi:hypothetical protein
MADETTKVVILSVELDLNQFSQAVSQAEKDLEGLLTQQAVLIAQNKQGTQEYALLSAQIQKTRKDYKDNAAALNTVQQLQKKNTGSIIEMRRELSAATLQYNNLSKAERNNADVGGRLQNQIKGLSDELKKNGRAIGDNRMNVGNYEQAISSALSQTGLFNSQIGNLAGLMGRGGAFGIALVGAIGLVKGLEAAIGLTNSGAEFLERRTAGIGAAFDVVKGKIATFANVVSSFPIISALFNLPSNIARVIAGDEIVEAGEKITEEFQNIEDAERDLAVQTSANNVLIDQYIARSKNRTLGDKERLDILRQASELEKQNLDAELALESRRLSAQQSENDRLRQAGVLTDADLQKAVDIQVKVNNLKQESLSLQERIQTRQDQILDAAEKRNQERIDKAIAEDKRKQAELQKIGKIIFVDDYKALLDQRESIANIASDKEELELKQRFANRLITEEQYAEQLIQVEINRLQRELEVLEQNAATDLTLEDDVAAKKVEIAIATADAKIKENERVTANTKKETDKQIKIAQEQAAITEDFIVGIGQAFSDSLTDQGLQVESFAKNVLLVVLDTLEKTITASIATATATSLAQPDSVATFGVTGIARAAVLTGLIKAAFAVVKGQIGKDSGAKFAHGGLQGHGDTHIIGGQPHSRGGTKFIGSDGTRFEAEKGELITVINKRSTDMLRYWSNINQIGGGVDFFKTSASNYMADGGFAARSISSPIQNQFSQSQDLPPIIVLVEDINSAQGIKARVESRARF